MEGATATTTGRRRNDTAEDEASMIDALFSLSKGAPAPVPTSASSSTTPVSVVGSMGGGCGDGPLPLPLPSNHGVTSALFNIAAAEVAATGTAPTGGSGGRKRKQSGGGDETTHTIKQPKPATTTLGEMDAVLETGNGSSSSTSPKSIAEQLRGIVASLGKKSTAAATVSSATSRTKKMAATNKTRKEGGPGDSGNGSGGRPASPAKQHQLPLFLSKTYHMIDQCDPTIATWSKNGDSFVVKDVDTFASTVLPMYFKHSNFSSFARQLNFYGFRKLRSDPILLTKPTPPTPTGRMPVHNPNAGGKVGKDDAASATSKSKSKSKSSTNNHGDEDEDEASYVRFYHEKFQKNKPELLHTIRRATTKSYHPDHPHHHSHNNNSNNTGDVGVSQEIISALKSEVTVLTNYITQFKSDTDHKLSALTMEYNRRMNTLTSDYDKLAQIVHQLLLSSSLNQHHQPISPQQQLASSQYHQHSLPLPQQQEPRNTLLHHIQHNFISNTNTNNNLNSSAMTTTNTSVVSGTTGTGITRPEDVVSVASLLSMTNKLPIVVNNGKSSSSGGGDNDDSSSTLLSSSYNAASATAGSALRVPSVSLVSSSYPSSSSKQQHIPTNAEEEED